MAVYDFHIDAFILIAPHNFPTPIFLCPNVPDNVLFFADCLYIAALSFLASRAVPLSTGAVVAGFSIMIESAARSDLFNTTFGCVI